MVCWYSLVLTFCSVWSDTRVLTPSGSCQGIFSPKFGGSYGLARKQPSEFFWWRAQLHMFVTRLNFNTRSELARRKAKFLAALTPEWTEEEQCTVVHIRRGDKLDKPENKGDIR